MKGYSSLKQFIEDYKLYKAAKNIDVGRDRGETITNVLKRRMDEKFKKASRQFNTILEKNSYTKEDLILIAIHDSMNRIHDLDDYIKKCYGNASLETKYKNILTSRAFRNGRLKNIYSLLPNKISTKKELLRFIKTRYHIRNRELEIIIRHTCGKQGEKWFNELVDEGKINSSNGRWFG